MLASLIILGALILSFKDRRMFSLILIFMITFFFPFEIFKTQTSWCVAVIISDLIVLLSALILRARASLSIAVMSGLLIVNHIIGWNFGGYLQDSPYRLIAPFLEYLELGSFILFSECVLLKLKGKLCQVSK